MLHNQRWISAAGAGTLHVLPVCIAKFVLVHVTVNVRCAQAMQVEPDALVSQRSTQAGHTKADASPAERPCARCVN